MENLDRSAKLNEFADICANGTAFTLSPLSTDASSRKYYRLHFADGGSLVVMDDEGCRCRPREFVELSVFLRAHGVYVPEVKAQNLTEGFLLLEDLGDDTVAKRLTANNEYQLYRMAALAVAEVAAIRKRPPCVGELSRRKIAEDLRLFTEWYFPMVAGHPLPPQAAAEFFTMVDQLTELAYRVPNRLVLWDYHIDNIMLPDNEKKCAIIDFQDAMWGPLTYDIVSLLAADRRSASAEVICRVKDDFFNTLENVRREDFEDSFAFLSLFRHLRVLGRFTTLSMVNGKNHYLNYIPQIWKMLEQLLQYPKLSRIGNWLNTYLPQELRRAPTKKPFTQAMILAAGRGIRMGHLTESLPKPLIKVDNKALIDYNFDRLKEIGIKNAVVNLCYKGNMIRSHLTTNHQDFKLIFSEESEALETGGGVKKALPLLKDPAFFVCNSDVFFIERGYKPVLWRMMDAWDEKKYDILLLLQDIKDVCGDKGIGDYRIDGSGKIERNAAKTTGYPYMFGGISIVNRTIFAEESRKNFSLRDLFDLAQIRGRLGFVINDAAFFHIGTPEALQAAEIKIYNQKQKRC